MTTETNHELQVQILSMEKEYNSSDILRIVRERAPTPEAYLLFLSALKYYKPYQPYHNLDHAKQVVKAVLAIYQAKDTAPDFCVLLAAIWHDAIYVPNTKHSEVLSAKAMIYEYEDLHSTYLKPDMLAASIVPATTLIRLTTIGHHLQERIRYAAVEQNVLLDADLSGMAEPDYYTFAFRQESILREQVGLATVTQEHYAKAKVFLQKFLDKKSIYRTPEAVAMWEDNARANLLKYCFG